MLTRGQRAIVQRALRTLQRKRLRVQRETLARAFYHEHAYCWRCRHTLYDCQCSIASMEDWFT